MDDRIKLAEAMFPDEMVTDDRKCLMLKKAKPHQLGLRPLPNPFTNANDDYAVLEWMRRGVGDAETYTLFKMAYCNDYIDGTGRWYLYEIGDYARAACTVLEITVEKGNG